MIPIQTLPECDSTMNVAAKMVETQQYNTEFPPLFAVRAVKQTKGRGTGGRTWVSNPGNLHLTIAVPNPWSQILLNTSPSSSASKIRKSSPVGAATNLLMSAATSPFASLHPKTMALFPCIIGITLFNALNKIVGFTANHSLSESPLVLKWPNDVLIRATGQKVCGNLIESGYDVKNKRQALLIGIGANIESEIVVSDGGRTAGLLKEVQTAYHQLQKQKTENESTAPSSSSSLNAEILAEAICSELVATVSSCLILDEKSNFMKIQEAETNKKILKMFAERLDWNTTIFLRKEDDPTRTERGTEPFKPVRLTEFGGLVAKSQNDGREVELASEYLF